jgi:hypothetical protein
MGCDGSDLLLHEMRICVLIWQLSIPLSINHCKWLLKLMPVWDPWITRYSENVITVHGVVISNTVPMCTETCHLNETSYTKFLSIVFVEFSCSVLSVDSLESNVYLFVCLFTYPCNNLCLLLLICLAVEMSVYLIVSHQQMIIFHSIYKNKDKTPL